MSDRPLQHAVADDGTAIVGKVEGQGPPLVFAPASPSDGTFEWAPMSPHLTEQFTCYVMDRGSRARNADAQDHSPQQLIGDVVAFIESIGEQVGLVGSSWSGMLALGAARRTSAVRALGLWEPWPSRRPANRIGHASSRRSTRGTAAGRGPPRGRRPDLAGGQRHHQ